MLIKTWFHSMATSHAIPKQISFQNVSQKKKKYKTKNSRASKITHQEVKCHYFISKSNKKINQFSKLHIFLFSCKFSMSTINHFPRLQNQFLCCLLLLPQLLKLRCKQFYLSPNENVKCFYK